MFARKYTSNISILNLVNFSRKAYYAAFFSYKIKNGVYMANQRHDFRNLKILDFYWNGVSQICELKVF